MLVEQQEDNPDCKKTCFQLTYGSILAYLALPAVR